MSFADLAAGRCSLQSAEQVYCMMHHYESLLAVPADVVAGTALEIAAGHESDHNNVFHTVPVACP